MVDHPSEWHSCRQRTLYSPPKPSHWIVFFAQSTTPAASDGMPTMSNALTFVSPHVPAVMSLTNFRRPVLSGIVVQA
eukprot:1144854-Pelagomonas_calceolata.AAC.4